MTTKKNMFILCLDIFNTRGILLPASEDWRLSSEEERIVGYIVTSGPRFYQLLPDEVLRRSWFDKFQRSNFKCLT